MVRGGTDGYDLGSSMCPVFRNDGTRLTGLSHLSRRDDFYKGLFIPKGQIPYNCTSRFY